MSLAPFYHRSKGLRIPQCCNHLLSLSLTSISRSLPPTSNEREMSRFSSVAYSLLPSSPTKSTTFTSSKPEQSNESYHDSKHSRSTSLNAIGSSSFSPSLPSKRSTRRRTALLTTVALIAGAGLLHTFRQQSRTASPDVQFDHRHRIAVDFETTDVPEEWSCNPFKEPGRMLSDDTNAVSSLCPRF